MFCSGWGEAGIIAAVQTVAGWLCQWWGSPAYLDVHATLQCRTFHDGGASPTLRPVSKSHNG